MSDIVGALAGILNTLPRRSTMSDRMSISQLNLNLGRIVGAHLDREDTEAALDLAGIEWVTDSHHRGITLSENSLRFLSEWNARSSLRGARRPTTQQPPEGWLEAVRKAELAVLL